MRKSNSLLHYSYFNEAFIAEQISRSKRFHQKQCKSAKEMVEEVSEGNEKKGKKKFDGRSIYGCVCVCMVVLENAFASTATKNILRVRIAA